MNTFYCLVVLSLIVTVHSAASRRSSYGPNDKPEGYFQYVNVPTDYEYEFGFNRGNAHHTVSRYEQSRGHTFHTKVKWNDAYGGYGEHVWDYNHGDSTYKEPDYKPVTISSYYAKPSYKEELVYQPVKGYKKNAAYYAEPASAYRSSIDQLSVQVPVYKPKNKNNYKSTGYNPSNGQEYPIDYSPFQRSLFI